MVVVPMKFCVTIWEGFTVKINLTPLRPLPAGRQALGKLIKIQKNVMLSDHRVTGNLGPLG
jgi:hypothetical protein